MELLLAVNCKGKCVASQNLTYILDYQHY